MSIANPWLAVAITIFAWWISTGLILLLVRLPRTWHKGMLAGFGLAGVASFWGIITSLHSLSAPSIYAGFFCALVIWGWHEASFLMGIITGPRPAPCPPNATGWVRFGYATATLIYHEVALFLTLLALAAISWNSPNHIGLWTFALLFAMRLSSKFNIFLGVPNLSDEFFPDHLAHLKSYLPKRAMNGLMPLSILACLAFIAFVGLGLQDGMDDAGPRLSLTITLTLACLGLLEHIFMITPLPDAALWRWAAPVRSALDPVTSPSSPTDPMQSKKTENG
jgi:putative photosynthetic complex assembly protein 2